MVQLKVFSKPAEEYNDPFIIFSIVLVYTADDAICVRAR